MRWCVDGTYFHTWCGLSANLRCRSETCCTRLAGNTGRKKVARYATFGHHCTTLLGYIFATKARSQNMVYFGLLAAEICWRVWGTPAHFNGFRVLAALLHSTLVVGVSQTTALNKGRHLHSAGRPSRWASAHVLVEIVLVLLYLQICAVFACFLQPVTVCKVTVGLCICRVLVLRYIFACARYGRRMK